jgi:hypothetical protein
MTDLLEPNIEAYGKYARASALADYAELLSIKGYHVTVEQVTDYCDDIGWRGHELIRCPNEQTSDDSIGEQVFAILRERSDLLRKSYPFELTSGRLRVGKNAGQAAYVAFLCLLTAHAYDILLSNHAHETFELSVAEALKQRGLRVAALAAMRRAAGRFDTALQQACQEVNLRAAPDGAAIRTHAHDEGVDLLCHLDWSDQRPGTWAVVGQATCSKSDAWQVKLAEPKPIRWAGLLSTIVQPQRFLSVPHHVDRCMMRYLAEGGGIVLDRVRLTPFRPHLLPEETDCIEAVLDLSYEPLA